MHLDHLHYLPLSSGSFSLLAGVLAALVVLAQLGALRYAYLSLGIEPGVALLLLVGSLVGSYFNVPVLELPDQRVLSGREVDFYGMGYIVPVVVDWPGTVVAVNVGGALIPSLVSVYLLFARHLWTRGILATAAVAVVVHGLAQPIPGVGIAVPVFAPALITALAALLLSWRHAAALAYVGGSVGTLVGADLSNLGRIQGLGAPVASIGGAGTFDGVFLTGILAVLLASLTQLPGRMVSRSTVRRSP